jgi:hypothetical protein
MRISLVYCRQASLQGRRRPSTRCGPSGGIKGKASGVLLSATADYFPADAVSKSGFIIDALSMSCEVLDDKVCPPNLRQDRVDDRLVDRVFLYSVRLEATLAYRFGKTDSYTVSSSSANHIATKHLSGSPPGE